MISVNRANVLVGLVGAGALTLSALALQTPEPPRDDRAYTVSAQATASASPGSSSASDGTSLSPTSALVPFRPPTKGAQLLFLGGRITKGFFASSVNQAYPALLSARLKDEQGLVDISARSSSITLGAFPAEPVPDQDLLVLEVGSEENVPVRQFAQQYGRMTESAREYYPKAALVCLGVWGGAGNAVDGSIRTACERAGGTFVRLADLFGRNALRGPAGSQAQDGVRDDYFPNDQGHEAIADKLYEALVPRIDLRDAPTPAA